MEENTKSEEKNLSEELYTDEKQKDIEAFKGKMEELKEEYTGENKTLDTVKAILGFFAAVILAFGWMLLMLLLVSFVSLSYFHFEIGKMILFSALFAIAIGIVYVISKIRKTGRKKRF